MCRVKGPLQSSPTRWSENRMGGEGNEINWALDQGASWKNFILEENTPILFRVVAEGNFIRNLHWISSSCILWLKIIFIYQCVSSSVNYYCAMKSATSLQMNILLKDVLSFLIFQISNFINYLYCKLKYFNIFYGFTKTYLLSQNFEKHNII